MEAVASARNDGWEPIVLEDVERRGAVTSRNTLLDLVDPEGPTLIRYMDDDDELLPHRQVVIDAFKMDQSLDIVYTDNVVSSMRSPGAYVMNHLWGDPVRDLLRVNPWTWVARLDTLTRMQKRNGFVWDPADSCMEGLTCWLRFLEAGLVIRHLPVEAYRYNRDRFVECITQTSNDAYRAEVVSRCRRFKAQGLGVAGAVDSGASTESWGGFEPPSRPSGTGPSI